MLLPCFHPKTNHKEHRKEPKAQWWFSNSQPLIDVGTDCIQWYFLLIYIPAYSLFILMIFFVVLLLVDIKLT